MRQVLVSHKLREFKTGDAELDRKLDQHFRDPQALLFEKIRYFDTHIPDHDLTEDEITAGVTPVDFQYPPGNVLRYGKNLDPGTTDMTAAIQAAIDVAEAATIGGRVHVPAGLYLTTSTITIADDRIHIYGDGIDATRINFVPVADDTLLHWTRGGTSIWQCSIKALTLYSTDSTFTKVAMDINDARTFTCEDVWIGGSTVVGSSSYWGGDDASIGVRTQGREFHYYGRMLIAADRPIIIEENPNDDRDSDHFHFEDLFLIANDNPVVEIGSGLGISNLTFDGYQSWNLGTHGLYWVDVGAPPNSSYAVRFDNVRTEQGTDSNAHTFHIEIHASASLRDLTINGCQLDTARDGLYLRRVERILLDQVAWNIASGTGIDVTFITNTFLSMRECFWQTGSSATLTNSRTLWAAPNNVTMPTYANAELIYDGVTDRAIVMDGAISQPAFSLANDGIQNIGATGMQGMLTVVTSLGLSAIFELAGTNNAVREASDPSAFFTITATTANRCNVYWSAGNSRYELENKLGSTVKFKLFFAGSYTTF